MLLCFASKLHKAILATVTLEAIQNDDFAPNWRQVGCIDTNDNTYTS
jgi:hypothetical protein